MKKERFKAVCAVYLVLQQDAKVLLLRRANTGYHDGDYGLASGHVEPGEGMIDALLREAEEEVNLKLNPQEVKLAHVLHRFSISPAYVDFFFICEKWEGEPTNQEPQKCDDMAWFDIHNLPTNMMPYVREALNYIAQERIYNQT